MRNVSGTTHFIGHAREAASPASLREANIQALVDLAINELPVTPHREMPSCRIPLNDGGPNHPAHIRLAIQAVAAFIADEIPTLVFCSAGMSRSPAIAAGGLALAQSLEPIEALHRIRAAGPCDISPAMWTAVLQALGAEPDDS